MAVYFFGSLGHRGHHWWDSNMNRINRVPGAPAAVNHNPWQYLPDWDANSSTPEGLISSQSLGRAKVTQVGNFTVLALWDRTGGDTRSGSASIYVINGSLSFDDAVAEVRSSPFFATTTSISGANLFLRDNVTPVFDADGGPGGPQDPIQLTIGGPAQANVSGSYRALYRENLSEGTFYALYFVVTPDNMNFHTVSVTSLGLPGALRYVLLSGDKFSSASFFDRDTGFQDQSGSPVLIEVSSDDGLVTGDIEVQVNWAG